jgi:hypothetical protein
MVERVAVNYKGVGSTPALSDKSWNNEKKSFLGY